jgi:hypothetical protein
MLWLALERLHLHLLGSCERFTWHTSDRQSLQNSCALFALELWIMPALAAQLQQIITHLLYMHNPSTLHND